MIRLAHLVTHPVQYQAPLFRRIAVEPDIEFTSFFQTDVSTQPHLDPGFNKLVNWDVPMLDGYTHRFLPSIGPNNKITFWRPWTYGFGRALTEGKFDALWISGYLRPAYWAAILAAKRRGVRVLIRDDLHEWSKQRGGAKRAAKRLLFSLFSPVVDRFLAIGSLNRGYYLKLGVKSESIFLMPYAVDNSFFQRLARSASLKREGLRKELGLQIGRPIILFVGKLHKRKGASDLLESYLRLVSLKVDRPPYLLFVGDGEERGGLEARTKGSCADSIRFLGFQSQTELPRFYDLCDVFVMPSREEPWGLVLNEAMNAGRAIISNERVGSAADLLVDGVNGYFYETAKIDSLTDALQKILSNPARLRAMGEQSLRIINRWSFEDDVTGLRAALGLNSPNKYRSTDHCQVSNLASE